MSRVDAQPVTSSIDTSTVPAVRESGAGDIGRMWLRLALFFVPIFVLVVPPVYYVDPFGVFAKPSVIPEPIRSKYAQQVNQVFWKLPAYKRDPAANVLLGDSEMARLSVQVFAPSPARNTRTLRMVAEPSESRCPRSGLRPAESNSRKLFSG